MVFLGVYVSCIDIIFGFSKNLRFFCWWACNALTVIRNLIIHDLLYYLLEEECSTLQILEHALSSVPIADAIQNNNGTTLQKE